MLQRAKQAAEANPPPKSSSASNSILKKQLFPSSSPCPPTPSGSGAAHQGDIAAMFKKPRVLSGSTATSRPSANPEPLQSHSANISRPAQRGTSSNGKASFASLYSASSSFTDSFDTIEDSSAFPSASRSATIASSVYIQDDDFSDDENLDLDFEAPSALPSLPSLPPPHQRPVFQKRDERDDFPGSNMSALSWSQSSPSHYHPPRPKPQSALQRATKRDSPDDVDLAPQIAKKPKRQLPKDWSKPPKSEEEDVQELYEAAATPAPKAKNTALWNTSASAVKAQKKQLKTQQKAAVPGKTEAEEIKEAVKSSSAKATAITLSSEQHHVKNLVVEKGQSVFFTGPAGTGKSVLMRAIIKDLKEKYAREPERVAVTASTGLAACNIGGMTLHSFSGIGLGKEDAQALIKKIRRNPKAKNRWLKTKTLVIDEISMVDGDLFDKLSQIGRIIRNNGRPWGGIQLIITGDFFQLPPVPDGSKSRDVKFAFEAATWNMSIDHTIGLTEVFRQRDSEFADMLNEMRLGRISERTIQNFKALSRPLRFTDGLEATELFPTRNEVESSNQRRLKALPGQVYRFDSYDSGDPAVREKLLANMMAPTTIELKKGAQVMLIKNMDDTLVNGSLGTVVDFMSEATFEIRGASLSADSDDDTDAKKRAQAFSNMLTDASTKKNDKEYPLVSFQTTDGGRRVILCYPEDWKVELPTGEVQASRKQLPLILAWALSIHKAQGQTLERVVVDLGKVFEKGQAYVALSRATTQQGLQVIRFHKDKVMAHPRVVGFYNKLYSAETAVKKKPVASIANFAYKQAATSGADVIDLEEEEALAAYA